MKAFQRIVEGGGDPTINPPRNPLTVGGWSGSYGSDNDGHSGWAEGRVHQAGFTTTFRPNSVVPHIDSGQFCDVDYTTSEEGSSATLPTFAAITSRSYHAGIVKCLLLDGAVRTCSENVDINVWRAMGTRSSGEVVGDF